MKYILLVLNWETGSAVMPPKKVTAGAAPKAAGRTATTKAAGKATGKAAVKTTSKVAGGAAQPASGATEKPTRGVTGGDDDDSDDDINDLIKKEEPAVEDSDTESVVSAASAESEQYYDEALPMMEPAIENLRREIVIVPDNERRTSFRMDLYTAAALITMRAGQIAETGRAFVETTGLQTADEVAKKELLEGKCPLIVRRKVGQRIDNNTVYVYYEHFRPAEMIFPQELRPQ